MSNNRRLKMPTKLESPKKVQTRIASPAVCVKKFRGNVSYPGGGKDLKGRGESEGKRRKRNKILGRKHRLIVELFYCN